LEGLRVLTLCHAQHGVSVREALASLGLPWPQHVGDIHGDRAGDQCTAATLLVRRHPEEILMIGQGEAAATLEALAAALAPGQHSDAVVIDLSHGNTVIALEGPQLDAWMSHLVDAQALPTHSGRASHTRLADVPVALLRLAPERLWLLADRAVSPYIANWLAFSHQGAFETDL
jgi:heterotetrameric sarcosine oxidase gamma subunit